MADRVVKVVGVTVRVEAGEVPGGPGAGPGPAPVRASTFAAAADAPSGGALRHIAVDKGEFLVEDVSGLIRGLVLSYHIGPLRRSASADPEMSHRFARRQSGWLAPPYV